MLLQLPPGWVGLIEGEKELPPPGDSAFSVPETVGGADDVVDGAEVVDDGVVVVVGSSLVLLHPAVSVPIVTIAAAAPASASRLIIDTLRMISHLLPGAGRVPEIPLAEERSTADLRVR